MKLKDISLFRFCSLFLMRHSEEDKTRVSKLRIRVLCLSFLSFPSASFCIPLSKALKELSPLKYSAMHNYLCKVCIWASLCSHTWPAMRVAFYATFKVSIFTFLPHRPWNWTFFFSLLFTVLNEVGARDDHNGDLNADCLARTKEWNKTGR